MRSLDISIRPEEIKQLLIRYDPVGAAKELDIRELDLAFEAWRSATA